MKDRKVLYKMLVLALPVLGLSFVQADTPKVFKPSPEPVFSTPRAKPNIHMVLDDSGSMGARDVKLKGQNVTRVQALEYTVESLIKKYNDKAYLGISLLNQPGTDGRGSARRGGVVRLKLADYSKDDMSVLTNYTSGLIRASGGTPVRPSIYETIKMFRGQPVSYNGTGGIRDRIYHNNGTYSDFYKYAQLDTPLRYRCQQNHLVVMTDGDPNGETSYGIGVGDYNNFGLVNSNRGYEYGGVNLSDTIALGSKGAALGKIAADTDLRYARKPVCDINGQNCKEKLLDDADKPWDDELSLPMPINMHTVSLQINPKAKFYTELTKDTGGMNLGFAQGQGSAEDLLLAFDTIFSSIILSTSSTLSMNDRIHSDMLTKAPSVDANGNVDLKSLGTIRYDTIYDFRQNFGSVRAMVPYISSYDTSKKDPKNPKDKGEAIISTYELWSTDKSITPTQGRYVTLSDGKPGLNLVELAASKDNIGYKQFHAIDKSFEVNHMDWLTNFKKTENLDGLRGRLNPLGSITNSDITTVNKDILSINVSEKMMGRSLSGGLNQWLLYKARHQPKNLLIVGDNDGFISFINAQRGLTGNHKGGHRDTAYFPQMLVPRFQEIAGALRTETLVMDGRTNLVDAQVFQDGGKDSGHLYATLGLTAMGGGGRGFVGYRIYSDSVAVVNKWITDGRRNNGAKESEIYHKVTPLFEITNESINSNGVKDFEDLGYTYSGFEFFNRIVEGKGQAVAVFGNGFGTDRSVLYFIDAYTGKKLHEIVLDPKGMGAATPSIIVSSDNLNGQKIDRIYVGDYSGTLYKVEFAEGDFMSPKAEVTALFKAPESVNFGQSAISVKPLVVRAKNSNLYRVFFGTGLAASLELDRGDHSLVTHGLYGITDIPGKVNVNAKKVVSEKNRSLQPLLTVKNLKKGVVNYSGDKKPNYEILDKYDLELQTPTDSGNNQGSQNENGWYMVLASDNDGIKGSKGAYGSDAGDIGSGERVIRDPQYDAYHDAVVFSTWAIREREGELTVDASIDPCVSDLAYGKILSFKTRTGSHSSGISLVNKGTTGTAQGVLTGDSILNAPEGNNASALSDLDEDTQTELVDQKVKDKITGKDKVTSEGIVDSENSSYEMSEDNSGVYCVSGIDGKSECEEIIRGGEGGEGEGGDGNNSKKPFRLSIQTLLNS